MPNHSVIAAPDVDLVNVPGHYRDLLLQPMLVDGRADGLFNSVSTSADVSCSICVKGAVNASELKERNRLPHSCRTPLVDDSSFRPSLSSPLASKARMKAAVVLRIHHFLMVALPPFLGVIDTVHHRQSRGLCKSRCFVRSRSMLTQISVFQIT